MPHPRDHILPLSYLGSAAQTDVTLVTVKVRVNGGAATTYSSVTTPAITQNADNTSLYEIDIPASTYSDGDRVARTWYYNSVVQTSAVDIVIPNAVDGSHYTNARGDNLANLDAAVSTRSTYAGGDTSGTTTLLSRLTSGRATNLDNLDATVSSRSTVAAVWAAVVDSSGVTTLLSRLTSGRATNLDNLDATVSSRSTYAGGDTSGTTTLLSRLTSTRAGYLDNLTNLDAAVSGIAASVWNTLTSGLSTAGSIGRLLVTNIDATISSRLPTSSAGSLTFVAPVLPSGTVNLVQGDDYLAADGRALTFTSTTWPSVTGATITFELRNSPNNSIISYSGGVVSSTQVQVELTHVQTGTLAGPYKYDVQAALATSGDIVTLVNGICNVAVLP